MPRIKMLDKVAMEEGTYPIKFNFKDKNGDLVEAVAITSLYWWLTLVDGTPVNDRSAVSEVVSENPWPLVLSGDDLQLFEDEDSYGTRVVTLKITYNSDYGSDLPETYAVMFKIQNILVIAGDLNISVVDVIYPGEVAIIA